MDGKDIFIGVMVLVIAIGAYNFYTASQVPAQDGVPADTDDATPQLIKCGTVPTVNLDANDKFESGQKNWGTWTYIIDGGSPETDSDGSFSMDINNPLTVLAGNDNSSVYYRQVWTPTVDSCTVNSEALNTMVKFDTYEVICYNEIGDPINGSTYGSNLSIGTGGSRTVECTLTGVAKTGTPYGSNMFLELNSTTYKENDLTLTWDGATITPEQTNPGAYKLSLATGVVKTFDIPAFEGAVVKTFYIVLSAETSVDPGAQGASTITSYGNGIAGYIIPKNCYQEEDVSPAVFKCGMEDMDSTFVSPGGTTKATASVAQFLIPVK